MSMNERAFKRFLKTVTNWAEPKKPSILPKASGKANASQTKALEEQKKPSTRGRRNKNKPATFDEWMPEANEPTPEQRIAVSVIGIANSVELFRGELN